MEFDISDIHGRLWYLVVSYEIVSGFYWWEVSSGTGNDPVSTGTKPSPEPVPKPYLCLYKVSLGHNGLIAYGFILKDLVMKVINMCLHSLSFQQTVCLSSCCHIGCDELYHFYLQRTVFHSRPKSLFTTGKFLISFVNLSFQDTSLLQKPPHSP